MHQQFFKRENAKVTQGFNKKGTTSINAFSQGDASASTSGDAIRVGQPGGNNADFVKNPHIVGVTTYTFSLNSVSAPNSYWNKPSPDGPWQYEKQMIPLDEGFCFLTRMGGSFDDGADYMRLRIKDNHWFLQVGVGCEEYDDESCSERNFMTVEAMCYAYDQSN